jgi:histone H3/H4
MGKDSTRVSLQKKKEEKEKNKEVKEIAKKHSKKVAAGKKKSEEKKETKQVSVAPEESHKKKRKDKNRGVRKVKHSQENTTRIFPDAAMYRLMHQSVSAVSNGASNSISANAVKLIQDATEAHFLRVMTAGGLITHRSNRKTVNREDIETALKVVDAYRGIYIGTPLPPKKPLTEDERVERMTKRQKNIEGITTTGSKKYESA